MAKAPGHNSNTKGQSPSAKTINSDHLQSGSSAGSRKGLLTGQLAIALGWQEMTGNKMTTGCETVD